MINTKETYAISKKVNGEQIVGIPQLIIGESVFISNDTPNSNLFVRRMSKGRILNEIKIKPRNRIKLNLENTDSLMIRGNVEYRIWNE